MMGIRLVLDARQVVQGGQQAERALQRIEMRAGSMSTNVNRGFRNLESQLRGISMAMSTVGMASVFAGRAIVDGVIKPSYEAAKRYESALAQVKMFTHASASDMEKVRKTSEELSSGSMFSPTEMAKGIGRLANFMGSMEEGIKMAPVLKDLLAASFGEIKPEDASRLLGSLASSFPHEDIRKTADEMVKAVNVTAFELPEMFGFISSTRAAAAKANLEFHDMIAMGGIFRATMSERAAGQTVNAIISRFTDISARVQHYADKNSISYEEALFKGAHDPDTTRFIQGASKLGVDIFDPITKKAREVPAILKDMSFSLSKMDEKTRRETAQSVFATLGGTGMAILERYNEGMKKLGKSYQSLGQEVHAANGEVAWAARLMEQTPEGIQRTFEAAVDSMRIALGAPIMAIFVPIIQKLTKITKSFTEFLKQNPMMAKAIGYLVVGFAALLIVGGTLSLTMGAIAGVMSFLMPVIAGIGAVSTGSAAGMAAFGVATKAALLPFLKLIGVFGLFYLAYNSFADSAEGRTGSLKSQLMESFTSIGLVLRGISEWWSGKGGPKSKQLKADLDKRGLLGIVVFFVQTKKKLELIFGGFFKGFTDGLKILGNLIAIVLIPVQLLIKAFSFMFSLLHGEDFSMLVDNYKMLGYAIGYMTAVVLSALGLKWLWVAGKAMFAAAAQVAAMWEVYLIIGLVIGAMAMLSSPKFYEAMQNAAMIIQLSFENVWLTMKFGFTQAVDYMLLYLKSALNIITNEEFNAGLAIIKSRTLNLNSLSPENVRAQVVGVNTGSSAAMIEYMKQQYLRDPNSTEAQKEWSRSGRLPEAGPPGVNPSIYGAPAPQTAPKPLKGFGPDKQVTRVGDVTVNVDARGNGDFEKIASNVVEKIKSAFSQNSEVSFG